MRLALPVAALAAIFNALFAVGAAQAQSAGRSAFDVFFGKSVTPPWERSVQRYYDRERMALQRLTDPLAGLRLSFMERYERALQRFYADPALAMGLPANKVFDDTGFGAAPNAVPVTPPSFSPTVALLDADGDGIISRGEYFNGRRRFVPAGAPGIARAQRIDRRLAAQFRAMDSDGDGRVSPVETAPYPNARF